MKNISNETLANITIAIMVLLLMGVVSMFTSLYWKHQSVVHHAAFFESDSWGNVSFHWNDDSYAHTPFQDTSLYEKISQDNFLKVLNSQGIK